MEEVVPIVSESARKHGISDEALLHALRNPIRITYREDDVVMIYGPDWSGCLIEVGYVESAEGDVVVIHAMETTEHRMKG